MPREVMSEAPAPNAGTQPGPEPAPESEPETAVKMENNMHDKCKNVVAFHNNLSIFLKSLKGVLPEYIGTIRECIKHYKSIPRSEYLEECEALLKPHIEYISQYDDGIFTDDYAVGPRFLLPKMDFREIWTLLEGDDFQADVEFQAKTKKAIFNHIQTIYVSIQMALNQINVFNKNIEKQKTFLMDMMENLQMDEKIKERIEEMKKEEAADEAKSGSGASAFGLGKLTEMFGEDNFVYQLAKDVAEELDMGTEDIENPVEAITQLFANNGKKLQELIVTVGDKIEQKVQSGEIDKEKLVQDAKAMKDKLEGFMGKIPGLEDMMKNNGMVKQFTDMYQELDDEEQAKYNYIPDLLEQNLMEWTDEQKVQFDEYAKYVMDKQEAPVEEDIDAVAEPPGGGAAAPRPKTKTKTKTKTKRPKGAKRKSRPKKK
jgi:hypothetical protein